MWGQQQQQQQQSYLRYLASRHSQQQSPRQDVVDEDRRSHQHQHPPRHQLYHQHQEQEQQLPMHQQHLHHRTDAMDLPLTSASRASRNMAEKQRRDNLNTNISKMAALVPTVTGRKMDKISILRLAAAFLRTQYTLGCGPEDFLPRQFNDFDLEQYFFDNLIGNDGFFIVLTTSGKIVYVSRQVEQQLGHAQNELLGQSLYTFVYPEDHEELTRNLTPDESLSTVGSSVSSVTESTTDNNSNSSEDSTSTFRSDRKTFREQRRSFQLRMSQRTVSRREHTQYEYLQISGILRLAEACKNFGLSANRMRHRESTATSNDVVFVGIARLPQKRPITELSIMDANKQEYVTRHLVDGRIIYCDHRISIVAGYLSEEVSGLSAFSFMHKDDLRWTIIGLRQMYDRAETCGSSCYRLLSKTGDFIYLRTHGYLEYDKDTQTVVSFVCINTLVSEKEGIGFVKEMKERFSATVCGTTKGMIQNDDDASFDLSSESQNSNSKGSLEDPSQLEDAITHLISDLPSPAISEDRLSPSPMPNIQYTKAAIISQRFPPAAMQANKIGIKKIDHCLVLQGKGSQASSKEESDVNVFKGKQQRNITTKLIDSSFVERMILGKEKIVGESEMAEQKTISSLRKSCEVEAFASNQARNLQENVQETSRSRKMSASMCVLSTNNSNDQLPLHAASLESVSGSVENCNARKTSRNSQKGAARSKNSHKRGSTELKVNQTTDAIDRSEKHEYTLGYLENCIHDSEILSSDSESNQQYSLKRIHSVEDIETTISVKKKQSDISYEVAQIDRLQRNVAYIDCRDFGNEQFSTFSIDFDQYNNQGYSKSSRSVESPNSNLQETNIEYQQLDSATPPIVSSTDDEQFADLQDLKDDPLEKSVLDQNPGFMMKIFNDLRPVISLERSFEETNIEEYLTENEHNIKNEIRKTHFHLSSNMAIRETQFDALSRDLENSVLHAQKTNSNQRQTQQKLQK